MRALRRRHEPARGRVRRSEMSGLDTIQPRVCSSKPRREATTVATATVQLARLTRAARDGISRCWPPMAVQGGRKARAAPMAAADHAPAARQSRRPSWPEPHRLLIDQAARHSPEWRAFFSAPRPRVRMREGA